MEIKSHKWLIKMWVIEDLMVKILGIKMTKRRNSSKIGIKKVKRRYAPLIRRLKLLYLSLIKV